MVIKYAILSRERGNWLLQRPKHTLKQIAHLQPELWIRTDDTTLTSYVKLANKYNVNLRHYDGSNIFGYAQTADKILSASIEANDDVLFIFDDDLVLSMHNPILGKEPAFIPCDNKSIKILLEQAAHLVCPELPALSFTPIMSRTQPCLINYCSWLSMVTVFYISHFKEYNHRFWQGKEIEAYCDVNFSLQLLRDGFLTANMTTLLLNNVFNNPGGCSLYRTLEVQNASVEYLKKIYPTFVRTHKKYGFLDDKNVERESPIVNWKKAFNYAKFKERFGILVNDFIGPHLRAYEKEYASFIEELRHEH